MNKNGFTLVELLGVIVVLSLLALLTTTAVTKLVSDSKQELSDVQINSIKSAAEAWSFDNLEKLPDAGECFYLTLGDLKEYGFFDSSVIDPKNNVEISDNLKIKISSEAEYGKPVINYEVSPDSVEGCSYFYDSVCTYIDEDNSGTINLSDTVTCGTELFHVMSNDGKK